MKIKISPRLSVIALVLFALACSEELKDTTTTKQSSLPAFNAPEGIEFNGEYLVFPTPQLFDKTMVALKNSDVSTVSLWTQKIGLTSMRDIYQRALKEQDDYLVALEKKYESLPDGDKRLGVKVQIPQSDFVKQYASLFDFDEYGAVRRLRLSNPVMDGLVNENGLVKIAGHIFQYNEFTTKIIVGGDATKIKLLPEIQETSDKLKIVVKPVTHVYKTGQPSENGRLGYYEASSYSIGYNDVYQYYFNYVIDLYTQATPIYDTENPVCDPPGCGSVRAAGTQDCTCYFNIIDYYVHTTHTASMECRKIWRGTIDTQHASATNQIQATVHSNFSYVLNPASVTNHGYVNCILTLYNDELPNNADFTDATYEFYEYANTSSGIQPTGGIVRSWTNP